MAPWFFKILLWHGFITHFQQVGCFRNSRFGNSQEEEIISRVKKYRLSNRNLQGDKGMLTFGNDNVGEIIQRTFNDANMRKKRQKKEAVRTQTTRSYDLQYKNNDFFGDTQFDNQVLNDIIGYNGTYPSKQYKLPTMKFNYLKHKPTRTLHSLKFYNIKRRNKRQTVRYTCKTATDPRTNCGKQEKIPKTIRTEFLQTADDRRHRKTDFIDNIQKGKIDQVPDDDIEDDGTDQSGEHDVEPAMQFNGRRYISRRYFYRNNKKHRIPYQLQRNNLIEQNGVMQAFQSRNAAYEAQIAINSALFKEDAIESTEERGPVFDDSMTWVNMMRAGRGWFPNGTSV